MLNGLTTLTTKASWDNGSDIFTDMMNIKKTMEKVNPDPVTVQYLIPKPLMDKLITLLLNSKWIIVKEKLPGPYECVLIATTACNADGEEFVSIGVRENGEWKCLTGPMSEKEFVTHWMPLPNPPEVKKNA
jgi:hypothetical protein